MTSTMFGHLAPRACWNRGRLEQIMLEDKSLLCSNTLVCATPEAVRGGLADARHDMRVDKFQG